MAAPKNNRYAARERRKLTPLERFLSFCRFEPETGCVLWIGGKTRGRGHNDWYGSFWFEGARWLAHRWAAKFIHGFDIEELQVDHCCPNRALPDTLCVAHVQPLTSERNRHLQTERRRTFIHLEVGLVTYEDVYGPQPPPDEDLIPFYAPPAWLTTGAADVHCPF